MNGQEPAARRAIVDEDQCNKCHGEIRAHGELRTGVDLCVMCHKHDTTDEARRPADQMPPVTVNFKDMLHQIHTGAELENGCIIYGFGSNPVDFSDVRFPGDRKQCDICHVAGAAEVPLPSEALPTVVMQGEALVSEVLPERAACMSCHDSLLANVHAVVNSDLGSGAESCAICHGADADFAVSAVHAATP
jgi:OmcA/MtrC family decaheme c-type cytochrome